MAPCSNLAWPGRLAFHGALRIPSAEIEEYARILVRHARNVAVRNCDALLPPNAGSPKRWRQAVGNSESLREVLPDAIDEATFSLLRAIHEGTLQLKFVSSSGKVVDLADEGLGELAGWFMGSGGWRAMFAEERFVDDFAGVAE